MLCVDRRWRAKLSEGIVVAPNIPVGSYLVTRLVAKGPGFGNISIYRIQVSN